MATYSDPQKRREGNGKRSSVYYVKVYEGGRQYWKSTRQRNLKLAKQCVETWRYRDVKGERHVEDRRFDHAIEEWLDTKESRVSLRAASGCTEST